MSISAKANLAESILARHFPGEQWRLARPSYGLQKEAYIGRSDRRNVLLKFDGDTPAWERLVAIGAAPELLARGRHDGRPYMIQAFVEGTHPDRAWFAQNLAVVGSFFRRLHNDEQLREILAAPRPASFAEHVRHEVSTLAGALSAASGGFVSSARLLDAFDRFSEQSGQLRPVPLVPVHPDPSPANMLVTQHGLMMVDWDGVLLSDPMRDASLVAWWYLPEDRWQSFFDRVGTVVDRDRIFWWVARRSLEVALWFDARREDESARAFLDDFYRATGHRDNPRVVAEGGAIAP
jgi:hypothetical protein